MIFDSYHSDPVNKREGLKMFGINKNRQSIFTSNLTESPLKQIGQKVSNSEFDSVMHHRNSLPSANNVNPEPRLSSENPNPKDSESDSEENDPVDGLKLALSHKNAEIKKLQEEITYLSSASSSKPSKAVGINKEMYDQMFAYEKRRVNSLGLQAQMVEIESKRKSEFFEREKEKSAMGEMVRTFEDEKFREQQNQRKKIREYKEQLDIQKALQRDSRLSDGVQSQFDKNFEVVPNYLIDSPHAGYNSTLAKYTKRSPRNLIYNPITGILKETYLEVGSNGSPTGDIPQNNAHSKYYHSRPSNIFANKPPDHPFEEKNRNLVGYGNFVMQNK